MPESSELFDVAAGDWWRWERYELEGGFIRPAEGQNTLIRYNPWKEWRESRAGGQAGDPPYRSLVALLEQVPRPPAPEGEQKLLEWCTSYGLLGALLLQAHRAALQPIPLDSNTPEADIRQTRFFKTPHGWGEAKVPIMRPDDAVPVKAVIRPVGTTEWREEPLAKTWGRYFPKAAEEERETYQYPTPFTDEFCQQYAEPVDEFYQSAEALYRALLQLDGKDGDGTRQPEALLNALVSGVNPVMRRQEDGSFRQYWASLSLIESLSMMAFLDRTESRFLVRCDVCATPFVTGILTQRYCTEKCRWNAQKRRQRAKGEKEGSISEQSRKGDTNG